MTARSDTTDTPAFASARIEVHGCVQGVGVRPRIARLACEQGLGGCVANTMSGVTIDVEGTPAAMKRFDDRLRASVAGDFVTKWTDTSRTVRRFGDFQIGESTSEDDVRTIVPLDLVVCRACLDETLTPGNRRFGFAFTNCTECGPRYTILKAMPYDRQRTTMARYEMCDECAAEYVDPSDRRFHSQGNCCPRCGPKLWSSQVGASQMGNRREDDEAIQDAIDALRAGRIVAVKGIGGYQLLCDATNDSAVARLRRRKGRPTKPLAVMVCSMEVANQLAVLSVVEQEVLAGSAGPIVLVRHREPEQLSSQIHPGLRDVGLMLPTSPLHRLLVQGAGFPLVVTSGNVEGEPLDYEPASAEENLSEMADLFLHHDRPIHRHVDDSVVRCIGEDVVTLRAARGLAPWTLDIGAEGEMLAVGGQQKVAIALTVGTACVAGPHLGDLGSVGSRTRFAEQVASMVQLYGVDPSSVVRDLHPDYFSTRWATDRGVNHSVQHHHAHVVSAMAEIGWLDRTVLGVTMDGTGFGTDGTIWGGEFLLATATKFDRVAHLRPFPLLGGERAITEPWRIAAALLSEVSSDSTASLLAEILADRIDETALDRLLDHRAVSPITSSVGRLFDAVASIVLPMSKVTYEGEAAMRLESACDETENGAYTIPIADGLIPQIDWRPMIHELARDRLRGEATGRMAMRFHNGIADAVCAILANYPSLPVVFSGGVFQNRLLVERILEGWMGRSQPFHFQKRLPGDGGLALGQLASALTSKREKERCV